MNKLNLGCGFKKKPGFINVDKFAASEPDLVFDLTKVPWPWADSSADEIHFDFSLEQMGSTPQDLMNVLKEAYRVAADKAKISIWFFHPRHDQFFLNPMCVHRLSPEFFHLLSVADNLSMIPQGVHDNLLGLQHSINFEVVNAQSHADISLKAEFDAGRLNHDDLSKRMRFENNICHAVDIELKAIKS